MPEFATDQVIAEDYLLQEQIGEGGMGCVFKALQLDLQRAVAIKFLHPDLLVDEEPRQRFDREARILSGLEHRNIVRLYKYGTLSDLSPYMVMEFVQGASLRKRINEETLTTSQCLEIAKQICDAMNCAHNAGILHRDLKPENVLLPENEDLLVKLIDFGLARAESGAASQRLTQTGLVLGSFSYMSPEQSLGRPTAVTTDIYSLGCILFELIAGHPPFSADSAPGYMYKHANEPVPDLEKQPGKRAVPKGLASVVSKALAKAPEERYQSMMDLRRDLEYVAAGTPEEITAGSTTVTPQNTGRKYWFGATALVVIALCGSALNRLHQGEQVVHTAPHAAGPHRLEMTLRRLQATRDRAFETAELTMDLDRQVATAVSEAGRRPPDAACFQAYLMRTRINSHLFGLTLEKKYQQLAMDCAKKAAEFASFGSTQYISAADAYLELGELLADANDSTAENCLDIACRLYASAPANPPGFRLQQGIPGATNELNPVMATLYADSLACRRGDRAAVRHLEDMLAQWWRKSDRFEEGVMRFVEDLESHYMKQNDRINGTKLLSQLEYSLVTAPDLERNFLSKNWMYLARRYDDWHEDSAALRCVSKAIDTNNNDSSLTAHYLAGDAVPLMGSLHNRSSSEHSREQILKELSKLKERMSTEVRLSAEEQLNAINIEPWRAPSPISTPMVEDLAIQIRPHLKRNVDTDRVFDILAIKSDMVEARKLGQTEREDKDAMKVLARFSEVDIAAELQWACSVCLCHEEEKVNTPSLIKWLLQAKFPPNKHSFFMLMNLSLSYLKVDGTTSEEFFLKGCSLLNSLPPGQSALQTNRGFYLDILRLASRQSRSGNYKQAAAICNEGVKVLGHMTDKCIEQDRLEILSLCRIFMVLAGDKTGEEQVACKLDEGARRLPADTKIDLFSKLWWWGAIIPEDTRKKLWPQLVHASPAKFESSCELTKLIVNFELIRFGMAVVPPTEVEPLLETALGLRGAIDAPALTPTVRQLQWCRARELYSMRRYDEAQKLYLQYVAECRRLGQTKSDIDCFSYSLRQIARGYLRNHDYMQCRIIAAEMRSLDNPYDKMDGAFLTAMCDWEQKKPDEANTNFRKAMEWRAKTAPLYHWMIPELPVKYAEFQKTLRKPPG